jgi:hypothetical protein
MLQWYKKKIKLLFYFDMSRILVVYHSWFFYIVLKEITSYNSVIKFIISLQY